MKRLIALILFVALALSSAALAETTISPDMNLKVSRPSFTDNNPVIDGEDPVTGLPVDASVVYTPILVVLDGSENAYPHTGVDSASIIIQIPNQSIGNTKLLALFTSEYPERAGGTRSARMPSLVWANVFNSAYVSAGTPPIDSAVNSPVSVNYWRIKWGIKSNKADDPSERRFYDTLTGYSERVNGIPAPANLMAFVDLIHEDLIKNGVPFEKRPFLFTDEPLARGDEATRITMNYNNNAANCTFTYSEKIDGYRRQSMMGVESSRSLDYNYDRATDNTLVFSNVVVIRTVFKGGDYSGTSYTYPADNFTGCGQADIFQNGRYIKGSWYRENEYSRLIIMDEQGNELRFQRGKTFFALTSDRCVVSYE